MQTSLASTFSATACPPCTATVGLARRFRPQLPTLGSFGTAGTPGRPNYVAYRGSAMITQASPCHASRHSSNLSSGWIRHEHSHRPAIETDIPNPDITVAAAHSFSGMAHFATTGPNGATCRKCTWWEHNVSDDRSKAGGHHRPPKRASCAKFRQLTGRKGQKVPSDAAACRYFERH